MPLLPAPRWHTQSIGSEGEAAEQSAQSPHGEGTCQVTQEAATCMCWGSSNEACNPDGAVQRICNVLAESESSSKDSAQTSQGYW